MDATKKLFTVLVRPHQEFGNAALSPSLENERNLIEEVQRRATKMVPEFKKLEFVDKLKSMGLLLSLRYKRARGDMLDTYKNTQP